MSAQTGGRDGRKQDGKGTNGREGRTGKKTDFLEDDASLKQPGVLDDSMENFPADFRRNHRGKLR